MVEWEKSREKREGKWKIRRDLKRRRSLKRRSWKRGRKNKKRVNNGEIKVIGNRKRKERKRKISRIRKNRIRKNREIEIKGKIDKIIRSIKEEIIRGIKSKGRRRKKEEIGIKVIVREIGIIKKRGSSEWITSWFS